MVESFEHLDEVFERSFTEPVVLFKHSNSCGISSHILEMISRFDGTLNIVVVQQNREISNEIAVRTGYTHQSPQVFVLVDGKPIHHATHYGIEPETITQKVNHHAVR